MNARKKETDKIYNPYKDIKIYRYRPSGNNSRDELNLFAKAASDASAKGCLWDIAGWSTSQLKKILENSACAWIATKGEKYLALAWICPLSNRFSGAGTLHFMQSRASIHDIYYAARLFLFHRNAPARKFSSLMCLVPERYRPTRHLLERLGFEKLATLPEACHIAGENMLENGHIYLLKRENQNG